jgi:Zn ribbon nucleic-acid-binding protein
MKHYHILECNNQRTIAQELYSFLNKPAGPLNQPTTKFWNFLDKRTAFSCLKECPVLSGWFGSLDLRPREISFTLYNDIIKTRPHVDAPPVIAKINFPVSNTADTYNVWFNENDEEIDRVECVNPIVLRSNVKHTVEIGKKAKFPRIQVSFCFYKEPLKYLE